jgi:hypothetical protein
VRTVAATVVAAVTATATATATTTDGPIARDERRRRGDV